MRVVIRDQHRNLLGSAHIEKGEQPSEVTVAGSAGERTVPLRWECATDESGRITKCLACGCREVFARKDFPQVLGLTLVIVAAVMSVVFFAYDRILISMGVLAGAVVLDSLIYYFTPRCLVCYRCRTEYHDTGISQSVESWDLSIGEKYRPIREVLGEGVLGEGEVVDSMESDGETKVIS